MDRRDKIWLRLLTLIFFIFIFILAYVGWMLGQKVEEQTKNIIIHTNNIESDLVKKEAEIKELSSKINAIASTVPKDGLTPACYFEVTQCRGKDAKGLQGDSGTTTVINHDTQTIIEKQIDPEQPKIPEFAYDKGTKKLMYRFKGDDEWLPVSVICTADCEGE